MVFERRTVEGLSLRNGMLNAYAQLVLIRTLSVVLLLVYRHEDTNASHMETFRTVLAFIQKFSARQRHAHYTFRSDPAYEVRVRKDIRHHMLFSPLAV